jgi:hypothetical protein
MVQLTQRSHVRTQGEEQGLIAWVAQRSLGVSATGDLEGWLHGLHILHGVSGGGGFGWAL